MNRVIAALAFGGESEQSSRVDSGDEGGQVGMQLHRSPVVIIQPSPAQLPVVKLKTQGADQMQPSARIGAQSDDVASIGRNFRLV